MGLLSHIGWTDHTLNFWTGCKKVSAGCKFCYMYRGKDRWGVDPTVVVKSNERSIKNVLNKAKPGDKIFVCSWSDFFIEDADQWREEAWAVIRSRPDLQFQILTKRIERAGKCLPKDWGRGYKNVWLGVSVESEDVVDRVYQLLVTPAAIRFVSYEPALGPVNFKPFISVWGAPVYIYDDGVEVEPLDWIILGGESGNDTGKWGYRPAELEWFTDVVSQCKNEFSDVPLFVKQMGTHISKQLGLKSRPGDEIAEFPEHLRIQEFPKIYAS